MAYFRFEAKKCHLEVTASIQSAKKINLRISIFDYKQNIFFKRFDQNKAWIANSFNFFFPEIGLRNSKGSWAVIKLLHNQDSSSALGRPSGGSLKEAETEAVLVSQADLQQIRQCGIRQNQSSNELSIDGTPNSYHFVSPLV